MKFPEAFVKSLDGLPGIEPAQLLAALDGEPAVSMRFNPYKLTGAPEGRQVAWSRYGYYLDGRPQFTLDPLFHAGAYYVQEAGSMFVEHLYREAVGEKQGLRILDLCAAPGGKTTLLSTLAGLDGIVVANEVIRPRAMTLADNVMKWGLGNVVVTNNDPSHFSDFRDWFDVVLVDAPCSGEGMFRKNRDARGQWSAENVHLCAARQRRILADVRGVLKPGGVMIYSTCTFNRQENEDNIAWLAAEYGYEGADVEVPEEWGIVSGEVEGIPTFRFYPGRVEGEGFFAAALRRLDGKARVKVPKPRRMPFTELPKPAVKELSRWVAQPEFMHFASAGENIYAYYSDIYPAVRTLAETLSVVFSGVRMGQLFNNKLRPDHSLAMFHDLGRDAVPVGDLELETALDYLRKKDIGGEPFAEGLNLVAYEGFALGWLKRIGSRINNMYPKELRIQNL